VEATTGPGARGGSDEPVDGQAIRDELETARATLHELLAGADRRDLRRMCWDPYFKAYMTRADIYRYPTRHFEHHRRQLTLGASTPPSRVGRAR
jgi:hypothetical protein